MKKLFVILCVLLAQSAFAQSHWTVRTVPNTRLQGNDIHVSDPDGYLSDSTESYINTALSAIRDRADVFVVTLYSIGDEEPKYFATGLFNYWGIGDAETDNGVLLLFVEDQRALEFETGYGAEETLTDARCQRIFVNSIVPYFREGDYEGGLCAGIADIVEVYGGEVPDGLMSSFVGRGGYDDEDNIYPEEDAEDVMSIFGVLFLLFFLLPVPIISFFRWLVSLVSKKKIEESSDPMEVREKFGIHYFDAPSVSGNSSVWTKKGFKRFLLYGVSLVVIYALAVVFVPDLMPDALHTTQNSWATGITMFAYLTLTCFVQNRMSLKKADEWAEGSKMPQAVYKRAKGDAHSVMTRILAPWLGIFYSKAFKKRIAESGYCCPTCGKPMERCDDMELPNEWRVERDIHACNFSTYRCPSGHRFVERSKGFLHSSFINCKYCGAHAAKVKSERIIEEATYTQSGTKEVVYECKCCTRSFIATKTIPRLVHSSSSSSSSSSGYSRSSSSGGSFGGGHSGGGGYSGRW